jgi:hypothetical protein
VDVVVVAPDGQRDVAIDAFTYTAVPVIADIDPDAGPTNGGQLVTITGSSFQVGAYVLFDGKQATEVTVQSAGQLTCRTPANASGTADVTIGNLDGGVTVARDLYTYLPPPIIDKLSPPDAQERTALLNFADVQLSKAQLLDIESGWCAEIIVEWEELSAWYGGSE